MADILMQFPPGQPAVVAAALTGLLCAVLGAVQVVDGMVTTTADDASVVAQLIHATSAVTAAASTEFEQARWAASA